MVKSGLANGKMEGRNEKRRRCQDTSKRQERTMVERPVDQRSLNTMTSQWVTDHRFRKQETDLALESARENDLDFIDTEFEIRTIT